MDLVLNADTPPNGEEAFREDVKVAVAQSGLYEWLLRVVSVSGVIGGEEAGSAIGDATTATPGLEEGRKDEKDKEKGKLLGK